uniref:hatching enzyme 1.2-like n=1 Tax=Scatophagus argus TaxID=75038 RepID=UPI001ED7E625|nr:hatching enzyme 1.2-like [Scatophagus argus]
MVRTSFHYHILFNLVKVGIDSMFSRQWTCYHRGGCFSQTAGYKLRLQQDSGVNSVHLQAADMVFFRLSVLVLLLVSDCSWADDQDLPVSELLWRANKDVVRRADEPLVIDDIAYDSENERNADPCTSYSCMWSKSADGRVYVPYVIASHYTSRERSIIERGLQSFHDVSCIRFTQRTGQRDYLYIQSDSGCYSYVGRRGNSQTLSLDRQGCIYHNTVQHELLHALGFNHEQCRSDRDQYIRVLWENIQSGLAYAFDKLNTLNLNTPYDYNSVMQYHRYAFSKNGLPTMEPIPNPNVEFGTGTQMSRNDILRLNTLYKCH